VLGEELSLSERGNHTPLFKIGVVWAREGGEVTKNLSTTRELPGSLREDKNLRLFS